MNYRLFFEFYNIKIKDKYLQDIENDLNILTSKWPAINVNKNINNNWYYYIVAKMYLIQNNNNYIEYYLKGISNNHVRSIRDYATKLDFLSGNSNKNSTAIIWYYKLAIEKYNDKKSMNLLATYYFIKENNIQKAEEYYLKGIANNCFDAYLNIINVYSYKHNYIYIKKYLIKGINIFKNKLKYNRSVNLETIHLYKMVKKNNYNML